MSVVSSYTLREGSRREADSGAIDRLQVFVNGLLELLEKYRIESEFIMVEWNSTPASKPLTRFIKWPTNLRFCTVRVIRVPDHICKKWNKFHVKVPFHVPKAWNCGIRRARGKFILPAPVDLLYSDELIAYIGSKKLDPNTITRVDRCDVDRGVLDYNSLEEQLAFCEKNIIFRGVYKPIKYRNIQPKLHVFNSGDFLLMSKINWFLLRGYWEYLPYGMHIDSLLCYCAYAAGVKEVRLDDPMRIHHIHHERSFSRVKWPQLEWATKLVNNPLVPRIIGTKIGLLYYQILQKLDGVPTFFSTQWMDLAIDIVAGRKSYTFNDEDWGIGKENLEETLVSKSSWEKAQVNGKK